MPPESALRLLIDPPLDGPTNMARDETLLERVGAGTSPPTLRLYQWDRPTISLGYFQHYTDYEALPPPAGALPVVRRQTGGGAILHDLELTYSITLPTADPRLAGGANRLYELAHDAIIQGLSGLRLSARRCGTSDDSGAARGPFFCFERRHCYDVLLGDDKIAGSAQRRTRFAVLQHGSIILANRFPQQPSAFAHEIVAHSCEPPRSAASATLPTPLVASTPVESADCASVPAREGVPPAPGWFIARRQAVLTVLPEHFARALNADIFVSSWHQDEWRRVERLMEKYAGHPWTRRT